MKKIFYLFLAWRILLFAPLFSFLFIPYRENYEYTNIWKFIHPYFPVSNPLIFPWSNFDGVHYLSIAASGYSNDLGFFPLFPILIRFFSVFLTGTSAFDLSYFLSGFLISNILFLISLIIFYKLIKIDFSDKTALKSILFLLIFPTSFFFGGIYTESLFLLLSLLSFYKARKGNWLLSGAFAMLLGATRLVGVLILPALIYEFWIKEKKLSAKIIPLFLAPIGLLSYIFYNYIAWGNPFLFITAHEHINPTRTVNGIVLFPQTVFRYLKIISTTYGNFEWWIAMLELFSFAIAFILLYIAWKKKIRTSYLIFSILAFAMPISSGTFSGLPRYILVLFPIFISLSLIKSKLVQVIYISISIALLVLLTAAFSRGYFVA